MTTISLNCQRKKELLEKDAAQSGLNSIGEWSNELAKGFMPLDEEAAAFGEPMPERPHYNHTSSDIDS